ncbi:hypothetical protein P7C71_g1671, partial [Lecanoromycetidae sp. Uapishka_2]
MPTKIAYEWDAKRDVCYDMYITQNKPLEDVINHFRDGESFTPSKRAFQARFKEWGFPAKHRPAHREASLALRIRELWEVNTTGKQMFDILRGEGWDIKERELTKLRKDQHLLMRERNKNGHEHSRKRKIGDLENVNQSGQQAAQVEQRRVRVPTPELPAEIVAKRQARQAKLQAESDERLRAGTRRRRTKGWAGLPPDPVQGPRYPSELTMEECKNELGLDRTMYKEMRDIFEDICRANNVVKKTLCGAETWKRVKEDLINAYPHLQPIFRGPSAAGVNETQKPMALDLICMDVTKKMRTINNRVTITDAKNILGVTPQEGRDIRSAFDAILKGDYFVSKLEVSREYWEYLKQKWLVESPLLQQKLGDPLTDPDYKAKLKSIESIACDVQKRHRDEQTRKDPARLRRSLSQNQKTSPSRPSTGPKEAITATKVVVPPPKNSTSQALNGVRSVTIPRGEPGSIYSNPNPTPHSHTDGMTTLASQALASYNPFAHENTNMQIDPSLLEAAAIPYGIQHYSPPTPHPPPTNSNPAIPVYFRISPTSPLKHLQVAKKLWLDTFHPPHNLINLKEVATKRSGVEGRVGKVEGVEPPREGSREEGGKWGIDEDDELEAYLGMLDNGQKATFVVEIL